MPKKSVTKVGEKCECPVINGNRAFKTWCYTLNHPQDDEIEKMKILTVSKHRCCLEIGEHGTPHLQGVIVWKRNYRLSQLKKILPRVHWECAKCNDPENYCIKGEILINYNYSQQGKRNDLQPAIDLIMEGKTIKDVAMANPMAFVKSFKGLERLKFVTEVVKEWYPTEVHVIYGKPGTGKSRRVREICKEKGLRLYNVPEPINGSIWLDGYDGHEAILFDDFYGWVKYHTLLQWTDGYAFQPPVKGGFVNRQWTYVFITSNTNWDAWYENVPDLEALERRITSVTKL